jgi:hypothetical protein
LVTTVIDAAASGITFRLRDRPVQAHPSGTLIGARHLRPLEDRNSAHFRPMTFGVIMTEVAEGALAHPLLPSA